MTVQGILGSIQDQFPGMQRETNQIISTIQAFLGNRIPNDDALSAAARGLILEGPIGTGKSSYAVAVVQELGLPYVNISGNAIYGSNRGDGERMIRSLFVQAASSAKKAEPHQGDNEPTSSSCAILIIDDLEAIGKDRNKVKHVTDLGILAMLLEALDNQEFKSTVFVIGIASDVTSLDSSLLQPGRLEVIIRFASPGLNQRRMILQNLISRLPLCSQENNDEDNETRSKPTASLLDILTRWTRGYGRADLGRLCSEAMAVAWSRKRKQLKDTDELDDNTLSLIPIQESDWEEALERSRPMNVPWSPLEEVQAEELVGIDDILSTVMRATLLPLTKPEALAAMGISKSSFGVLLHGPPGTGKSTLGRALATVARPYASFMSIECPELINKVVGESERAVTRLFQAARQAAPCILFLDHIEAIAGARGFDTSSEQTMDRLLSTILIEMDGVASSSSSSNPGEGDHHHHHLNDMVIVVAATNHISTLDDAILRPGRLDLHVEMPLPKAETREAIWCHYLKRLPLDLSEVAPKEEGQRSFLEQLAMTLACHSDGLSGADIQGVCQTAALLALRERIDDADVKVRPQHILAAMQESVVAVG